jgi:hypothetical protein
VTKSEFSRNPSKVKVDVLGAKWQKKKKIDFQTTKFYLKKYNIFAYP